MDRMFLASARPKIAKKTPLSMATAPGVPIPGTGQLGKWRWEPALGAFARASHAQGLTGMTVDRPDSAPPGSGKNAGLPARGMAIAAKHHPGAGLSHPVRRQSERALRTQA